MFNPIRHRSLPRFGIACLLGVAACDDPAPQVTEHGIPPAVSAPVRGEKVNASSDERFGTILREMRTEDPAQAGSAAPANAKDFFAYDVPTGWTEVAASQFRDVNLRAGPNGELECYLTVGLSGGALLNINRWRAQFALAEATEADLAALPRAEFFGKQAYLVELAGTMTAMSQAPKADYAMVAVFLDAPQTGISVKATGPKDLVAAERPRIDAFVKSLRFRDEATAKPEPSAAGAAAKTEPKTAAPAGPFDPTKVTWTAPAGWTTGTGSSMRLVTYDVPGGAQIWVTPLSGGAGGLRANLDRWQGEMGADKLSDSALAALPTVKILGVESPYLDLKGTYAGMGGPTTLAPGNARVLAAACALPEALVTVKFVGPADVLEREKDNFLAFCRSLEVKP
jgi:hypothetical protein